MSEIDIQKLIDMNYRVLTLLGVVTSLLLECKINMPKSEQYKFNWFVDALNDVVYNGKPIPKFPEKQ
jgi:hypothetical protein